MTPAETHDEATNAADPTPEVLGLPHAPPSGLTPAQIAIAVIFAGTVFSAVVLALSLFAGK